METIISKKKLPLLLTSFAIHCLTKASAFVPQCPSGNHSLKTSNWKPTSQKETSPLAHFVRNSLPHKSFPFCSPMLLWKPRSENQDLETSICSCSFEASGHRSSSSSHQAFASQLSAHHPSPAHFASRLHYAMLR